MNNLGFQVYDPYGQNLTNVTNVQSAVPVNVQYPIIYQSPTRQLPSNVQPQENVFQVSVFDLLNELNNN